MLFVIGVLDTGVRMGLLTFLPFLLKSKGASLPTVGFALALVFLGGAAGKFFCGRIALNERLRFSIPVPSDPEPYLPCSTAFSAMRWG
jgi:hypothetical protein